MKLTEKIQTTLIGSEYRGTLETEELLSNIIGKEIKCYDSHIDDGADDESEDTYVMVDSFESVDGSINIRIYYGDCTGEIGYVSVDEDWNEE